VLKITLHRGFVTNTRFGAVATNNKVAEPGPALRIDGRW